ncbi:MAG TPA: hypothetical protein VHC49_06735 [Mycobacteriales bacterium]|nr:hypothetical protein [Mycobacteriales bacterium]
MQLATGAGRAPLAYALSAAAAAVYLAGTVILAAVEKGFERIRVVAIACCAVEFAGVIAVGIASLSEPGAFPDATVWSHFGSGYGYVPLVLPLLAGLWLFRGEKASRV